LFYIINIVYNKFDFLKIFILDNHYKNLGNKRESRNYDFPVKYNNKPFGQSFVEYLRSNIFNSVPYELKKKKVKKNNR
jgi:hypothetical protein